MFFFLSIFFNVVLRLKDIYLLVDVQPWDFLSALSFHMTVTCHLPKLSTGNQEGSGALI